MIVLVSSGGGDDEGDGTAAGDDTAASDDTAVDDTATDDTAADDTTADDTTPADLARWARIVYEGRLFDEPYLDELLTGVAAPELGPGESYGLAVMIDEGELGRSLGHDGFMPGYFTRMVYFTSSLCLSPISLSLTS